MKSILLKLSAAILIVSSISSCKIYAPTYERVENFKFERVDQKGFQISADAVFHNPNKLKFKIDDIAMDVLMDNKRIGTLGEKTEVAINKKADFAIPLAISVNPEMGLFEGLKKFVDILKSKEAEITLSGKVIVKAYGFKFPIPIQETQRVNLSKIK